MLTPALRNKTFIAQRLSRSSFFGLIILIGAQQLWPVLPQGAGQWAWLVLSLLPLLAFARGVVRQDPRQVMLVGLISLLYFIYAVVELMGTPKNTSAAQVILILSIVLFISGLLFARWRSEELKG